MRRPATIHAAAAIALPLLLASLAAPAAEFQARVRMTGPGDEIAGTIYVSGAKHSMLLEQAGRELVVFADRDAGITRLVSVAAQAQTVLRSDDRMLLMLDAFQSALHP